MVRKLEAIVPSKRFDEIRDVLVMNRSVHHLSYRKCVTTDEYHNKEQVESVQFSFMVVNKKTHEIIDLLTLYGVSSRFGTLNVTQLTSSKPRVSTTKETGPDANPYAPSSVSSKTKKRKKYQISDRLAYDEVYDTIDNQLHLTFDYLALTVTGGLIASCGLLTNSAVNVVASMLVSPLMGPIVGMTFGAVIKDNIMFWKSFRNELIGVFLCWLTGVVMGFITAPLMDTPSHPDLAFGHNTQISSRGDWIALAWGAGVAAPSGVGVALGVTSDTVAALIGVAISAALLPPIVNSGVCLASAVVFWIDPKYPVDVVERWWHVGYVSMLLFIINWVLIYICGILTFRVKKLHLSANEQLKMLRLSKFYEMREKAKDIEAMASINVIKPKASLASDDGKKKEGLRTPLLKAKPVKYSEQKLKDGVPPKYGDVNDETSMDGVPNMLAALSNNEHKDNVGDMINWDKISNRSGRGMSATVQKQAEATTIPRAVKRSSFDATKSQTRLLLKETVSDDAA